MEKFISYDKMSKKKQRELNENMREFWEYTKPYTRVLRDKKKYYRKDKHKFDARAMEGED